MNSDWTNCTLGDVLTLQRGADLPKTERTFGKFPVVASNGVVGHHFEAKAKAPGVVIGRSGSIGGGQYITKDFWPLNTTLWVKDFKGNIPRFCYYLLKSIDFTRFNVGSGVPTLNRNHIHPMAVQRPPIESQKRIVHLLGSLDDSINALQHENATLESIAQTLFRSWFVNFDPVHAKAAGKAPEAMSDEIAELFPSEFEDSSLGAIPKGWIASTVGDAFSINPRRLLSKGSEAPYLEMSNVMTKGHRPEQRLRLREFGSGTKFITGDTLLARITPCLENGKTAFVDFLKPGEVGGGSTEFIVLRSKDELPLYLSYLLARYEPFRQFAIKAMTGTSGRQRVDVSSLKRFGFVLPPPALSQAVTPIIDSLQNQMACNADIMLALSELRDHLLPRLISGKLSIGEAEKAVAALVPELAEAV